MADDDQEEKYMRNTPANDLDLQMLLTNPEWGGNIPPDLREKLKKLLGVYEIEKEDGTTEIISKSEYLWGMLAYYTRDIRLANITKFDGEEFYVRWCLDFAGDCLRAGYTKSFIKSLSMAITVLEVSQSRNGFLRRRIGTISQEKTYQEMTPPKRGLFGLGSKPKSQRGDYERG